jgi:fumarylacetoacetase
MAIDFGSRALPYCSFRTDDGPYRLGVGLGGGVVDLEAVAGRITACDRRLLSGGGLDPLLAAGWESWSPLRADLLSLADAGSLDAGLIPQDAVSLRLAWTVADYVDFYSSRHHAENVSRILRPDNPVLADNWLSLPVGYHGRSSTVVVDGTPVRRPHGQIRSEGSVDFGPTGMLDFEVELGYVVGGATELGVGVPVDDAGRHLFGVVLMNDWSARDIQAWEYVPLGPFLSKSFATSVSAWVMPVEALDGIRTTGPSQDPVPLPYLRSSQPWALDLDLEVWVRPAGATEDHRVTTVGAAEAVYWNPAQQLAHMTANGARLSPGDLFGSGTVSGAEPGTQGCLLELTEGGRVPLRLGAFGRAYLEDGDQVTMRARLAGSSGPEALGPVTGVVVRPDP